MRYKVTVYTVEDIEPVTFEVENLSFVNPGSYGPARNFGITVPGHSIALINLAAILAAEVEVIP